MVSTSTDGMRALLRQYHDVLSRVNTAYQNMTTQQENLAVNWTGESASTFGTALSAWLDDFKSVQTSLVSIIEAFDANLGVYESTNDLVSERSAQMAATFSGQSWSAPGLPGF